MVSNGYILQIPSTKLHSFIDELRTILTTAAADALHTLIAEEVEKLYDLKFIEGRQYKGHSILSLAVERVGNLLNSVQTGACANDRFDFRSSIIFIPKTGKNAKQYCLFNAVHPALIRCFEALPYVKSYKFFLNEPEKGVTPKENEQRGKFWKKQFESCGWNKLLLGTNAQLTLQPNLQTTTISTSDVTPHFRSVTERHEVYCRTRCVRDKIRSMVGNTPIDKINPHILTEMYLQAIDWFESEDGQREYAYLLQDTKKGILPIQPLNIEVEDVDVFTGNDRGNANDK